MKNPNGPHSERKTKKAQPSHQSFSNKTHKIPMGINKGDPIPTELLQDKKDRLINELKVSELKFRRLFEAAQDGILLLDANTGEITDANPFILKTLGFSRAEVIGLKLWELGPLKDVVTSKEAFIELKAKKYIRYDNLPLETKKGKPMYVEFISNVYKVKDKNIIQCNIRDITARVLAQNSVVFISHHDTLTNLYNRSFFDEEMHRLEHSRQFPISIFMVDVDGLKSINDKHGHTVGDEVLRRTANVLRASFRDEDVLARIGGDEFAIILPNTDAKAAINAQKRVESFLKKHNEEHPDLPLHLSIGAATGTRQFSLLLLLKKADDLMYMEKRLKTQ
jgi:diguanylate cyclase (GGDEF)-like protein/PAS domain S-box-containing protein